MKLLQKKGFTLIELLVVITIIGILATGATAVYTSQIQKARDTTRINDLKTLQSWVEQSYQDSSTYPKWSTLQTELVKYISKVPADSKQAENCNDGGTPANQPDCSYAYIAGSDSNGIAWGAYELSTAFENQGNVTAKAANDNGNDPARLEIGTAQINTLVTKVAAASITATATKGVVKANWSAVAVAADDALLVLINGQ